MHFMNPPPLMKLVEIVRGMETEDEVFDTIKALAERYCSKQKTGTLTLFTVAKCQEIGA